MLSHQLYIEVLSCYPHFIMKGRFSSSLLAQAGFFFVTLFFGVTFSSHVQAAHISFPSLFLQGGALQSQITTSAINISQLNQDLDFSGETSSSGSQSVESTTTSSETITQEVTGTGGAVNQDALASAAAAGSADGAQGIAASTIVGATQTGTGDQVNQEATINVGTFSNGLQRVLSSADSDSSILQRIKKGGPPSQKNQQATGDSSSESTAAGEQDIGAETTLTFTQDSDGGQTNQTADVSTTTTSAGIQEVMSTAGSVQTITQESEGDDDQSNQNATGSSAASSSAMAEQEVSSSTEITIIQE